ncbi:MAG: hypothetical protein JNN15_16575 [Blastocatellia bacterium]|nr:hypothetical protein [Blastocatellia bacterium]
MVKKEFKLFASKLKELEAEFDKSVHSNQFVSIASKAAENYQIIASHLMKNSTDKTELVELSKKFSQIESAAMMKCESSRNLGPTVLL